MDDRTSSLAAPRSRIRRARRAGWAVLVLGLAACKAGPTSAPPLTATPRASEPPASGTTAPAEAAARSAGASAGAGATATAGEAATSRDGRGKVTVTHSHECGYVLDQIYFEHNSTSLRDAQLPIVDGTAEMFRCALRTGEVTKWQVVGNADPTEQDPVALSLARARTVAAALVSRGVAGATLDISGAGATQPQDPRGTPMARAKNRRVLFLVLQRAGASP